MGLSILYLGHHYGIVNPIFRPSLLGCQFYIKTIIMGLSILHLGHHYGVVNPILVYVCKSPTTVEVTLSPKTKCIWVQVNKAKLG